MVMLGVDNSSLQVDGLTAHVGGLGSTDIYINILDAVPLIHVISNHVATDKLTTANGGTFTSSSASLSSQSH